MSNFCIAQVSPILSWKSPLRSNMQKEGSALYVFTASNGTFPDMFGGQRD